MQLCNVAMLSLISPQSKAKLRAMCVLFSSPCIGSFPTYLTPCNSGVVACNVQHMHLCPQWYGHHWMWSIQDIHICKKLTFDTCTYKIGPVWTLYFKTGYFTSSTFNTISILISSPVFGVVLPRWWLRVVLTTLGGHFHRRFATLDNDITSASTSTSTSTSQPRSSTLL